MKAYLVCFSKLTIHLRVTEDNGSLHACIRVEQDHVIHIILNIKRTLKALTPEAIKKHTGNREQQVVIKIGAAVFRQNVKLCLNIFAM